MAGVNVLLVNRASLIEMIQHYYDTVLYKVPPTVKSIEWNGQDFKVALEDEPPAKA